MSDEKGQGGNVKKAVELKDIELPLTLQQFEDIAKSNLVNAEICTYLLSKNTQYVNEWVNKGTNDKCIMPRIYVTDKNAWTTCGMVVADNYNMCTYHKAMLDEVIKQARDNGVFVIKWPERTEFISEEEKWKDVEPETIDELVLEGLAHHTKLMEKILTNSQKDADAEKQSLQQRLDTSNTELSQLREENDKTTRLAKSAIPGIARSRPRNPDEQERNIDDRGFSVRVGDE